VDTALEYDSFEDRLLAAIIGRAVKDYVVSRRRHLIDVNGEFNEPVFLKFACKSKKGTLAVKESLMLGCDRTEIRTAWEFMRSGGLEFFLDALAPDQDPQMVREYARDAILGLRKIVWK
jgi:hypothetical protein